MKPLLVSILSDRDDMAALSVLVVTGEDVLVGDVPCDG